MDGRVGGCCVARYAGGAHGASKVDRIMLRFRPIAPKPSTGGSVSPPVYDSGAAAETCSRRGKRRCGGAKRSNSGVGKKQRRALSSGEPAKSVVAVVTLPLLPEAPDRKESPRSGELSPLSPSDPSAQHVPIWLGEKPVAEALPPPAVVAPQPVRLVGLWVTVECVRETGGAGLVSLAEEAAMMRSLEKDTCPGFLTDGWDRVTWTNEAYRRMVGGEVGEVVVGLLMKERVSSTCGAFSCLARLQYTCRKERNSMTVPCDAWRMMEGKGFAWRLDVNAALCLGR